MTGSNQGFRWCGVGFALVLAGCAGTSVNHAPVEERATRAGNPAPATVSTVAPDAAAPAPVRQPPGFENAGKPGYYTVKPGDTLLRIAIDNGQAMQDVARWNKVENPNRIEVGQVLRVVPPEGLAPVKPVDKPAVVAVASAIPASAAPAGTPASTPVSAAKPAAVEGEINWLWPVSGNVLTGFDEVKNKGLDIGGSAGDPVLAAADGRVVYVGAGLRGYGNLIILKHDNVFLTAYAHNQTLLVKEDQLVARGQKIAEMGNSDADRVKLHFEVRRQGKPVDPAKYLPAR